MKLNNAMAKEFLSSLLSALIFVLWLNSKTERSITPSVLNLKWKTQLLIPKNAMSLIHNENMIIC